MKITAIVPCYNEPADRLDATLASIEAIGDVRIIVVDDGSDVAPEIARDVGLVVLPKNKGCAAALNAGIAEAEEDSWILRVDCGDTVFKKREQLEACSAAGKWASFSDSFDLVNQQKVGTAINWRSRIFTDGQFAASTTVFHKSIWYHVKFDESLRWCDDWDFAVKVQAKFGWFHFPEVTANVGCFPGGVTDRGKTLAAERNLDRVKVVKLARQLGRHA